MNYKLALILLYIVITSTILAQDVGTYSKEKDNLSFNIHGILSFPNSYFGAFSDNKTVITNRSGFKIGEKIGLTRRQVSELIWN